MTEVKKPLHNCTLAMIVKNESHIIKECLESVYKYIDYYCICDTGSTDDTKKIIKEFFDEKGIEGEIHDDAWEDFGTNRTKALERMWGKTQWALMIDADDYISGTFPIDKLDPNVDGYMVVLRRGALRWKRAQFFNLMRKRWHYRDVRHEYAFADKDIDGNDLQPGTLNVPVIEGDFMWIARTEGNRTISCTQAEKYKKDYDVLKKELEKDPNHTRYQFYAAQSAFDMGDFELAEKEYTRFTEIGKWDEELYFAWIRIGVSRALQNKPKAEVIEAFLRAFNTRPSRAEALFMLSECCRSMNLPAAGFIFAGYATTLQYPVNDLLFIDEQIYQWGILSEISQTAYYVQKPHIGYNATQRLVENDLGPTEPEEFAKGLKEQFKKNLDLYGQILAQQQAMILSQQTGVPLPTDGKMSLKEYIEKVKNKPKLVVPKSTLEPAKQIILPEEEKKQKVFKKRRR